MTGLPRQDVLLQSAIRRQVPVSAPAGLRDRILTEVEATPQVRPVPAPLGRLADADRIARRRALLLVAAALLALGLVTAGVVGAYLDDRQAPVEELAFAPPTDLPAFVRSTYDLMPELEPVTITFRDGPALGRIFVDSSGAIRTERYTAAGDTEPATVTILNGTRMGVLMEIAGEPGWYEQDEAIGEDPRVFVYAALGAARGAMDAGCEVAVSPGEEYAGEPARNWQYLGVERVAGRPAHHVRCGGELWIDIATRVTLRSRGSVVGEDGRPIAGQTRTIEVTEFVPGQPPAELFEIRRPAGVAAISDADYQCAQDPRCSASPAPVVTPPPAPAGPGQVDVEALVAAAATAPAELPASDIVIEHWTAKYPASTERIVHDGAGRWRVEWTHPGVPGPAAVTLLGPDYRYANEITPDGLVFWRDLFEPGFPPEVPWSLALAPGCPAGWLVLEPGLIAGRPAEHLTCPGSATPDEYWIDRATGLVVRVQTTDPLLGTVVDQVVEVRFGPSPAELFELPDGAEIRP